MPKLIKYLLVALGSVFLILTALAAYFAITFDPNDYKQQVIDLVQQKKQRTLTIEGEIKLSFWPKIGANLGKIAISEHQSPKQFAAVNNIKVALAVLPLLKKQLVVDTIYVDGAQANIVKHKDGTTNFDDLLSKDDSESQTIKFDVEGVDIGNSKVSYLDESTDAHYSIEQLDLKAGHIALAEPFDLETTFKLNANQPLIAADVALKGNFLADPEQKHYRVKKLDSHISGNMLGGKQVDIKLAGDVDAKPDTVEFVVDGLKLAASGDFDGAKQALEVSAPAINIQKNELSSQKVTVSLTQAKADANLKISMVLADMKGSPKAIESSGISGDIDMQDGKRTVKGKFASPFKGNIDQLVFDIPKLVGQLNVKDPSLPGGALDGTFNIGAHAELKNELANTQFNLVMADTKLNGDVAIKGFKKQQISFNLNADTLDLNKLLGQPKQTTSTSKTDKASKPADFSALKDKTIDGKVNIGNIFYDKYKIANLKVAVKGDGDRINLSGLNVKVDDSQIKGGLGISHFANPLYSFDIDIDQLNLDRYVTASKPTATEKASTSAASKPLDLTALKALNADGSVRIGQLSYGKTKMSNVRVDLKAENGVVNVNPFAANLYQGNMNGSLKVDARTTPSFDFKQNMKNVAIGPLLQDSINNDMLSGTGNLNIDVNTAGNTVEALKKGLAGDASLALADGAVKGIDIAASIREIKSKVNFLKSKEQTADQSKKTDFSELTATFNIKNGVAHNEDLAMKAPILRLAKGDSHGDINIGNETINYTAKPTIVKSLKGQGGADLDELSGIAIPIKISGTFAQPKYGLDFTAVATGLAQSKLLDKVGGEKGAAVKELINGGDKADAIKGLLGKDKSKANKDSNSTETPADTSKEKPKSVEEKAGKKLKELLNF